LPATGVGAHKVRRYNAPPDPWGVDVPHPEVQRRSLPATGAGAHKVRRYKTARIARKV